MDLLDDVVSARPDELSDAVVETVPPQS